MRLGRVRDQGFREIPRGWAVISLPEVVARAQAMDLRGRFVILLLGASALAAVGCSRDLDPGPTQTTGAGGAMSDAGSATGGHAAPPDATNCNDVVNAVHVSTENPGDACLFLIPDPDPNVVVDAYRITVNGAYLPQDTINGWTYTDATQRVIRIVGPTCDAIKAGSVQTVVVEYYCSGIA